MFYVYFMPSITYTIKIYQNKCSLIIVSNNSFITIKSEYIEKKASSDTFLIILRKIFPQA